MSFVLYVNNFLHKMFDFSIRASQSKYALLALIVVAFTESSFFLVPPDLLLIPMAIAKPSKAFLYAFICTLFSVLGGIFGYAIGFYSFEVIGKPLIEYYNYQNAFESLKEIFSKYDVLAIFIAGFSPVPYKIFTIASGFLKVNLVLFIVASFVARALRFFLIAVLIYKYGEKAKLFIENNLGKLTILFCCLLVIGFLLIQ